LGFFSFQGEGTDLAGRRKRRYVPRPSATGGIQHLSLPGAHAQKISLAPLEWNQRIDAGMTRVLPMPRSTHRRVAISIAAGFARIRRIGDDLEKPYPRPINREESLVRVWTGGRPPPASTAPYACNIACAGSVAQNESSSTGESRCLGRGRFLKDEGYGLSEAAGAGRVCQSQIGIRLVSK